MEETAEKTVEKTSTWLALRNPRLQKTLVGNGRLRSCIGAHNTAVYWALNKLGASPLHIALMATVSALPYTLFTLPAGAIADMVRRPDPLPCPSCAVGEWDMCRNGQYTERGIKERWRIEPEYAIKVDPSLGILAVLLERRSEP